MRKLLCIATFAAFLTSCGFTDTEENVLPETFAKLVAEQKYSEAIAQTIGSNQWGNVTPQTLTNFTEELIRTIKPMGAYKFHQRIGSEAIGDNWKKTSYLMGFERQPLLLVFTLYKPGEKWLVMNIAFHRDFTINNGTIDTQ
jgi:hypothetical protein